MIDREDNRGRTLTEKKKNGGGEKEERERRELTWGGN